MRAAAEFIRANGGHRARARVHAPVAGAVRAVVVGARSRRCRRRSMLLPVVGAAERLRLRLLGAPDDRGAVDRQSAPAGARAAVRPRRAARSAADDAGARGARSSRRARGCWRCSTACCAPTSAGRSRPLRRLALAPRRALDRAPPGGRRLVGRDPAAVGLLADRAAPRGYPLEHPVMRRGLEGLERFMVEDEDDARGVGAPAGREPAPGSVPVAGVGHGARDDRAQRRRRCPRMTRRCVRAAEWLLGEEVTQRGDWAVARPRPGARRLGVRVRQRQLPRRRRHRRGRARAAPRAPTADGDPRHRGARSSGRGAGCEGMQSVGGGWGAFDADNTRSLVRELPFLDFGEVIDEPSADVTAHARRDARGARAARHARRAARGALADRPAGARRLVVRALGRQPRLRHRRRGAGADRGRGRRPRSSASAARCAGWRTTRTRTAAGARTRAPTTIRAGSAAARAPPRRPPGRCSRCTPPASARAALAARRALAREHPARGRRLGRAAVHRHRASRRTTTSTTTSTGSCSRSWRSGAACARQPPDGVRRAGRWSTPRRPPDAPDGRGGDGAGRRARTSRSQAACCRGASARTCSRCTASRGSWTSSATRLPGVGRSGRAARARLARTAISTGRIAGERRAPAAAAPGTDAARVRAAARAVRAADRGQPHRPARQRATRPGSSCAATARCRPNPVGELVLGVFGAGHARSGSRCRTRSARRCSWPSTARTSPRISRAGACTCRPRTSTASGARSPSSRPSTPGRRCARCSRSRSSARAGCSRRGRAADRRAAGARAPGGGRVRGGRPRGAGRDRARGLRRARRTAQRAGPDDACSRWLARW